MKMGSFNFSLLIIAAIVLLNFSTMAQVHGLGSLPARMMSVSEVTIKDQKFNIIVIDSVNHGAIYSHRIPFRFPESFEDSGWTNARDYMEYVNGVASRAIQWIDHQYERRGLTQQGSREAQYLSYIKNTRDFLEESFSMVIVTEANDLNKIVATLRVSRVGADGLIPLERHQNEKLPRKIIWDEMGVPLQGPPEELKGLVVDRNYRHIADWFNVVFMTVGPMIFVQELYSPLRQRFEVTVPDKLYLECYRKMIPEYEKIGFRFLKNSSVSDKVVIMVAEPDNFLNLPRLLQTHRKTLHELGQFQFTKDFPKKWMPVPLTKNKCSSVFETKLEFYHQAL